MNTLIIRRELLARRIFNKEPAHLSNEQELIIAHYLIAWYTSEYNT